MYTISIVKCPKIEGNKMPGYISEKKKQFSIPFAVENVMFFFFNLLINDLRKPKRKLAHGKQKLKVPKIFYI